eukprot:7895-Pyramimonas_sp.AAC.1
MGSSSEWSPVKVQMALCIHGGWLPQTTPLPEKDVRVLYAGPHWDNHVRAREHAEEMVAEGVRE